MIKAIHLPSAIIGSITAKSKNNGVSFRISTPELSKEELGVVFDLQDQVVDLLIQPQDSEFPDIVNVKGELDKKPLHVRLRGALWVLAKKQGMSDVEAEEFYRSKVEGWISEAKLRIQEYDE